MLSKLINEFIESLKEEQIYNEFSLQHELGFFLKHKLNNTYKVEFERNISYFNLDRNTNFVKKYIDIVIYNEKEKYAIELKFPRNGQYPRQMQSFIKDIRFTEQLKESGFTQTYCLTIVDDKNYYTERHRQNNNIHQIYNYFRKDNFDISIPKNNDYMELNKEYTTRWSDVINIPNTKYYIIEIINKFL